ncbi:Histidine kinase-, DNA gyrase B-, and HSP90-like ATPase [Lachnospiraceae bacterium NLAE-zl-G231]|nr:Histidine kinase-, DNA gyrase B-, and HSP90-like ATPase [Lachnospiraceae bacterium NLAE-zl-G231]
MKKIQVNLSLKQRLLLLLILAAVILSGIIIVRLIPYGSQCKTEIAPLGFVGTYHTDGSETSHPADNKLVSAFQSKGIVMQGYFNRPLLKGEHLFFLMEYMEVHISLNGTPLFSFGTEESRSPLVRSSGMSWGSLVIPEDVSSADEWTIELSSKYQNNYYSAYRDFMDSLQTGDSGALARSIMQKYWFYIIGGLVFFFLSILLFLFALALSVQGIAIHPSVYLFSGFAMTSCFWILLSPEYSTLLFENTALIMQLEPLCILSSGVFLAAYLGSFMQTKAKRVNNITTAFLLLFIVGFLILQLMGFTDGYEVRTAMVIVLGLAALAETGEILYEEFLCRKHDFRFLMVPGLLFLFTALWEFLNYAFEWFPPGRLLFPGFILLMAAQLIHAIRYIRSAILMGLKTQKLENELTQNRISIMLSQIQPHFLYNSLLSIKQLCDTQPRKASVALEHFSYFLRGSLNSLSDTRLIPFEKELSHVRDYLYLEKMRFEERLNIEWDITFSDFLLPPLTLQPIVENAVRYGITEREDGGTLRIHSSRTSEWVRITVTDDGVGFSENESGTDGRIHIGLNNVRWRLENQCGGTLQLESRPETGTKVSIILPVKEVPE